MRNIRGKVQETYLEYLSMCYLRNSRQTRDSRGFHLNYWHISNEIGLVTSCKSTSRSKIRWYCFLQKMPSRKWWLVNDASNISTARNKKRKNTKIWLNCFYSSDIIAFYYGMLCLYNHSIFNILLAILSSSRKWFPKTPIAHLQNRAQLDRLSEYKPFKDQCHHHVHVIAILLDHIFNTPCTFLFFLRAVTVLSRKWFPIWLHLIKNVVKFFVCSFILKIDFNNQFAHPGFGKNVFCPY